MRMRSARLHPCGRQAGSSDLRYSWKPTRFPLADRYRARPAARQPHRMTLPLPPRFRISRGASRSDSSRYSLRPAVRSGGRRRSRLPRFRPRRLAVHVPAVRSEGVRRFCLLPFRRRRRAVQAPPAHFPGTEVADYQPQHHNGRGQAQNPVKDVEPDLPDQSRPFRRTPAGRTAECQFPPPLLVLLLIVRRQGMLQPPGRRADGGSRGVGRLDDADAADRGPGRIRTGSGSGLGGSAAATGGRPASGDSREEEIRSRPADTRSRTEIYDAPRIPGGGGGGGGGGGVQSTDRCACARAPRLDGRSQEAAATGTIHGCAAHRIRLYHGSRTRARPARRDPGGGHGSWRIRRPVRSARHPAVDEQAERRSRPAR